MKAPRLVEILATEFGKENILVHSEYHVQVVVSGTTKKHDVWLNRFGQLKWKLSHSRDVSSGSHDKMLHRMRRHDVKKTDFAEMQNAQQLSNAIARVSRLASENHIQRGIFCDAGFKDGRARISIIAVLGDEVEAFSHPMEATSIDVAERAAIDRALAKYNDDTLCIYSDSQSVVQSFGSPRIRWIPRGQNRDADRLANLRGK